VRSWRGLHDAVVDGTEVRCSVEADHLGELVAALGSRGVTSLTCQPPTLEELFLARYQAQPDAGGSPQPLSTQEQRV
jgi:ABC-2 type transport system ATP-binding protein